jgi:hypothetical protein
VTMPLKSVVAECLSNMMIQLDGRRHLQVDKAVHNWENRYRVGGGLRKFDPSYPISAQNTGGRAEVSSAATSMPATTLPRLSSLRATRWPTLVLLKPVPLKSELVVEQRR